MSDDLRTCPRCDWRYPAALLFPVTGSFPTPPICPPCALTHTNRVHRMRRKRFNGIMAEDLRIRALDWRRRHPEHAPTQESTS